jgi:hypothetical protein
MTKLPENAKKVLKNAQFYLGLEKLVKVLKNR